MLSNSNSFSSQSNPLDDHDYCSPRKGPPPTPFSSQSPPHKNNVTPFALNEASNDSVASSSSISSEDSSRDLMIDQDGQRGKPLAPKDTPSVSKPKLGRRPLLKKQFELGHLKQVEQTQQHPQQQQARQRKPRQSTSVTDKSQWITGEEQLDSLFSEQTVEVRGKRQRKEVHDPEFSHFSESSSSDAESNHDSEVDEEDDPNRLWCDCNKPDDGNLMLQCDICAYWFHCSCVGQTKKMIDRRELEKKEWFCSLCDHAISNGTPREAIPKRLVEKKKKSTKSGKRRGRPKKEGRASEITTRQSSRNAKKFSNSLDPKSAINRKSDVGSKSFIEFDNTDRLRELIKERKSAFFLKKRLAEENEAEKIKDRHNARLSVTGSLGNSLDAVASNTNSPNMNNLPMNIKQKERSKPNIVLQINTKKDKDAEMSDQRIVTTIVKKRKHSESSDPSGNGLFTADPIQLGKKSKIHAQTDSPLATTVKTDVSGDGSSPSGDSKIMPEAEKRSSTKHHSSKKKRKDNEANTANGSCKLLCPDKLAEKLEECLNKRRKGFTDLDISSTDIGKLATDIERYLHDCYKVQKQQLNKYRSILFNLSDPKNKALVRSVLDGTIKPERLVRMETAEMASGSELAKWREQESKHAIEMIKRESELAAQEVIVKKTHKGEEVIAASSLNDSDDLNISKNDHETPTKTPTAIPTLPDNAKSKESTVNKLSFKVTKQEPETSKPSFIESLVFLDTTPNHGNHSYDMNCKICNKEQSAGSLKPETSKSSETETVGLPATTNIENKDDLKQQPKEPKRLRISIQTTLDPADLSRLREPLIKPKEEPQNDAEYSPSKISPASESPNQGMDEDNEELYDPETSTIPPHSLITPKQNTTHSECWSGTISSSQIAKFNAIAKPVSGDVDFMSTKVNRTLSICGRIPPDQVGSYIKKLKTTMKNPVVLVQLFPSTEEDKASFNTFFDHLYTRNRCGVIEAGAYQPFLKDFYLLPIHEKGHLPEYLKPIEGPGLNRTEPNCLLGLLVKTKRPSSASSSSSNNTPTPAK